MSARFTPFDRADKTAEKKNVGIPQAGSKDAHSQHHI